MVPSAPGLHELSTMRELSGLYDVSAMRELSTLSEVSTLYEASGQSGLSGLYEASGLHEVSVAGGYAARHDVSGVGVPEGKCGGQSAASSVQRASRRRWSPSRRSTGFWEGRALFCKISSTALMVSMLLLSSDMLCSLK